MDNILLATTGKADCLDAEDYALGYCSRHGARLTILHVAESALSHYGLVDSLATEGDRREFIEHVQRQELPAAERRLARIMDGARSMNIKYQLYIKWTSPLCCILNLVRRTNPKLLVVGGGTKRCTPFGLVRRLARKAPCAVMQVPRPGGP